MGCPPEESTDQLFGLWGSVPHRPRLQTSSSSFLLPDAAASRAPSRSAPTVQPCGAQTKSRPAVTSTRHGVSPSTTFRGSRSSELHSAPPPAPFRFRHPVPGQTAPAVTHTAPSLPCSPEEAHVLPSLLCFQPGGPPTAHQSPGPAPLASCHPRVCTICQTPLRACGWGEATPRKTSRTSSHIPWMGAFPASPERTCLPMPNS